MRNSLFAAALIAVFALAGCHHDQVVATGPDGARVTNDGDGHVTYSDDKGNKVDVNKGGWTSKSADGSTASLGTAQITESELGLPFYPGSESTTGRDTKIEAKGKVSVICYRTTGDDPSKVGEFYKDKIKDATSTSSGEMAMVSGKLADGRRVAVMAMKKDGKTEIQASSSNE
jgi:hypothetical protein